LAACVYTVPHGAQLRAAGWRAVRGGTAPCRFYPPTAAARHTRHTSRAVLSTRTSTSTGGRWHADARRAALQRVSDATHALAAGGDDAGGRVGALPDELMLMVLDRLDWEPHESAAVRLTCPRWRSTHDGGRKTLRLSGRATDEMVGVLCVRLPALKELDLQHSAA
jgi:hypothetical protein